MPAIKKTANASGLLLWGVASGSHLKGVLEGLKIDNQSIYDEKIRIYDRFTTDGAKANATGATQNGEDFQASLLSGKMRFQATVPAGEFASFGREDLRECNFLGQAYVLGSTTTSDAVIIAQYSLN